MVLPDTLVNEILGLSTITYMNKQLSKFVSGFHFITNTYSIGDKIISIHVILPKGFMQNKSLAVEVHLCINYKFQLQDCTLTHLPSV